jgi:hypothetical protein
MVQKVSEGTTTQNGFQVLEFDLWHVTPTWPYLRDVNGYTRKYLVERQKFV